MDGWTELNSQDPPVEPGVQKVNVIGEEVKQTGMDEESRLRNVQKNQSVTWYISRAIWENFRD